MSKNSIDANHSMQIPSGNDEHLDRERSPRQPEKLPAVYADELDIKLFSDARALEISGPSDFFSKHGLINLYSVLLSVECFSYPRPPEWGGRILSERYSYAPDSPVGRQFVGDATQLTDIGDESYEVILASHVLEHIANPLKALFEWRRALRSTGMLVVVIPHFEATFDHKRSVTSLEHIIEDHLKNTAETDETHFDDVRRNSSKVLTEEWCKANIAHRGMHHHVFDTKLAIRVIAAAKFEIVWVGHFLPHHICVVGKKPLEWNTASGDPVAKWSRALRRSPFLIDRL